VHRSAGRTSAASLTIALATIATACSAERAAPVITRPPPPSTSTTTTAPAPPPTSAEPAPSTTTIPVQTTTTTTAVPVRPAAWKAFDDALAYRMLGSGDYAVSVAIAVDGRVVHTGAFGYRVPPRPPRERGGGTADRPPNTRVPTTTTRGQRPDGVQTTDRFRIASISKILTATVVLQLVEDGELKLDQPVAQQLADYVGVRVRDPGVAAITVRQLLSHTSGLSTYDSLFFGAGADSCPTAAQVGLTGTLVAPPGTRYVYSNLGFCLLGLLIEQVTGRPYDVEVKERLLDPLGITGMRLAATFDPNPDEVEHPSVPTRNYMEVLGPAGAWVATPVDLVKIVDSLDPSRPGWHPLSTRMLELMRRPARKVRYVHRDDHWYGLGLIVFADGSFGHTGTIENTHAMVLARPDGVTWSVLVSGEYPWETDDLRPIFDETMAAARIVLN
jgi:D-alanyl-D-alanine carboxypeptidase